MPTVSLTLEDVDQTIVRQAILNIVKDVVDKTNMKSHVSIIIHGDIKYAMTDNAINVIDHSDNIPSLASTRKVLISITEEYNEDALTTTAVHQQEYYPIFIDHESDIQVWPVYISTDYVISFSYRTPSRSEAIRWRDQIRARLSQTVNIHIHDVQYDVIIPEEVETFIEDVHTLKNRLIPQELGDYFREHSTKRIKVISDLSGGNAKLALTEKQVRIVGIYDFSPMPEKSERDDDSNTYTISFNYKLTMDKPSLMAIKYPCLVCNKLLPNKYLSFIVDKEQVAKEEHNRNYSYSRTLNALSHFESHRLLDKRLDINLPINIPAFDFCPIRTVHKGYSVLTTLLAQVNEDDKKSLFSLRDLDPFYMDEEVLEWIRTSELSYVTTPYASMIYLGLHQDGKHFNNDILELDNDLNIKSKIPLELCRINRVLVNFIIDLSILVPGVTDRLLVNHNVTIKLIREWALQIVNYSEVFARCTTFDSLKLIYEFTYKAYQSYTIPEMRRLFAGIKEVNYSYYRDLLLFLRDNAPTYLRNLVRDTIIGQMDIKEIMGRLTNNYSNNHYKDINRGQRYMQTSFIVALRTEDVNNGTDQTAS